MSIRLHCLFFIFIGLPFCVWAEKVELLNEYTFANEALVRQNWETAGEVRFSQKGVSTHSAADQKSSHLRSRFEVKVPGGESGWLTRVEWTCIPISPGSWGNDLFIDNGPVVVELVGDKMRLNQTLLAKAPVKAGDLVVQSCDFTGNRVFSWKINGQEQLEAPVSAWRKGPDTTTVTLADFMESKTETLWLGLRVFQVTPEDPLPLRLAAWECLPFIQTQVPTPYKIGQGSSMTRVFREPNDFQGSFAPIVKIRSAGRERESFQLVLFPLGLVSDPVDIIPSRLVHEDQKSSLSAEHITWGQVGYVQSHPAGGAVERVGWFWPDIVMPQAPFTPEPGYASPVWFTVDVPHETKPGCYRGFISFESKQAAPVFVGLELEVLSYSLPLRGRLKTAFGMNPGLYEAWYDPQSVRERLGSQDSISVEALFSSNETSDVLTREDWYRLYDFLLAHRLNPLVLYSWIRNGETRVLPAREDMEYCYERGLNAVCLGNFDIQHDREKCEALFRQVITPWESFILERKWDDVTWFIHGFDESELRPGKEKVDVAIHLVNSMAHRLFPWLKCETANPYMERHKESFDIWSCHVTNLLDKDMPQIQQAQAQGEEIWSYVSCIPHKPFSNLLLDYPGVDPRILGWQNYQHQVTGMLYYYINQWCFQENWDQDTPKWPDKPWYSMASQQNGDGILMYPGPGRQPLASIRMENLRDGIEDYEALALLAELTQEAASRQVSREMLDVVSEVLAIRPEVTTEWDRYTQDPEVILNARKEVDDLIIKLSDALK